MAPPDATRALQDGEAADGGAAPVPVTMVLHHRATGAKEAVQLEVYPDLAPLGAQRFLTLVDLNFYDGACFFRVMKKFVAQVGIPADPVMSEGWGEFKDDPVRQSNTRGWITFAAKGQPNTRSYQIFFNYRDNHGLDSQRFAPFAKVVAGMDAVDNIKEMKDGRGAPSQAQIQRLGNEYLLSKFPGLSCIESMKRGDASSGLPAGVSMGGSASADAGLASADMGSPMFGSGESGVYPGGAFVLIFVVLVFLVTLGGCRRNSSFRFNRDLEA